MKHHVEEHEDDEKHDGQDDLQSLLGAQFEFVLASPLEAVTRGQVKPLSEQGLSAVYEVAVISGFEVDVDIAGQSAVLVTKHGRTTGKRYSRYLLDGDLSAGGRGDQNSAEVVHVIAEVAAVPDVDGIPLTAFDVLGDHRAANTRSDGLLHIGDG